MTVGVSGDHSNNPADITNYRHVGRSGGTADVGPGGIVDVGGGVGIVLRALPLIGDVSNFSILVSHHVAGSQYLPYLSVAGDGADGARGHPHW